MKCPNCKRGVYGFWKYGENSACSLNCFRQLIADGKIARLFPERGYPELGISAPNGVRIEIPRQMIAPAKGRR